MHASHFIHKFRTYLAWSPLVEKNFRRLPLQLVNTILFTLADFLAFFKIGFKQGKCR